MFNDQQDELEADLRALSSNKPMSNYEKGRQTQLKWWQERHRWDTNKLELILRALGNNSIDMTDVAVVRARVEAYVDNHEDPYYGHDDSLYDGFDLTEFVDADDLHSRNGSFEGISSSDSHVNGDFSTQLLRGVRSTNDVIHESGIGDHKGPPSER